MKNLVLSVSVLLSLLVCPVLAAAQTAGTKVGVINIREAIGQSAEGKKASADINSRFQPRGQDMQRQQEDIKAIQDQLQKQGTTLSDEEQARLRRDLDEKQKIFQRASEDLNADYQRETQDVLQRLGGKMLRVISEYAQQNGFTLVIDNAQIPVYYAAKELDITAEVVKRYDAANPVEAAPAASATKTSAAPKPAKP